MILCLNLNAAIDKTIVVDTFALDKIHRSEKVVALAGGKGCNVARALQKMGKTPVVSGWVGGFAGKFIEDELNKEGIATDFIETGLESRTCTSILDQQNQTMTEIYENGERMPVEKIEAFVAHFKEIVGNYRAITLSGSLPPGVPSDIYARLIEIAHEANIPTYLDSSKDALRDGIAAKPFLVKPNEKEISVLLDEKPNSSLRELASAIQAIASRYTTIVALSLGELGALISNGQRVWQAQPPKVNAISAVGSGDSMVAGLVAAFSEGLAAEEAIKYGVAAGTANTLTLGAGQFSVEDFEEIREKVLVEALI
jgi:1-phosphofructokinase family hexose kinase